MKDTKDDLTPQDIFNCYRIGVRGEDISVSRNENIIKNIPIGYDGTYKLFTPEVALGVCSKYCVQDSVLVVKLMDKLQTWVGLCEMANVCNIEMFNLYTKGQQIRVFSQVYKHCYSNDFVVEKDGYVAKECERYTGAHVFDPVPGVYDRVVPFDFCLSGDTLITLSNGTSSRIDNMLTNKSLLGYNKEFNGFQNFSSINGLQKKGIKETVKIYLQDGRTITSTPDHKFMLENGEWCEAQHLKDKYVMSGIEYT